MVGSCSGCSGRCCCAPVRNVNRRTKWSPVHETECEPKWASTNFFGPLKAAHQQEHRDAPAAAATAAGRPARPRRASPLCKPGAASPLVSTPCLFRAGPSALAGGARGERAHCARREKSQQKGPRTPPKTSFSPQSPRRVSCAHKQRVARALAAKGSTTKPICLVRARRLWLCGFCYVVLGLRALQFRSAQTCATSNSRLMPRPLTRSQWACN